MAYTITTQLERKGNGIKVDDAIAFFRSLASNKISSGIQQEAGADVLIKALHTEFGESRYEKWNTPFEVVRHVPPRPAIRMYLYPEMKTDITQTYLQKIDDEKRTKLISPDNCALTVQEKVGERCQFLQQVKMDEGGYSWDGNISGNDPEHNGIRTVLHKGFDDPWISTGETIGKVDYKVTKI